MPIQKLRSPDVPRVQRSAPGSPENIRRLAFVLDFWSRVRPRKVPHGVFKYRSPDEAENAEIDQP